MRRKIWLGSILLPGLAMCAPAVEVAAGELHRCVGPAGVVYQDAPCGSGAMASKTVPFVDARPKKAKQARKPAKGAKPGRIAGGSGSAGTRAMPVEQRRGSCANARSSRDAALERLGLRRTFEDLRKLDDRVREACRGL